MQAEELEEIKQENRGGIKLEELSLLFLSHWYWFVFAVLVSLSVAVYKIMTTPPIYTRNTSLLIKDDKNTKYSTVKDFQYLGIGAANTNIRNEIQTISASENMVEVVRRLHLDLQMTVPQRLRERPLYNDAPVMLHFSNLSELETFTFKLKIVDKNHVKLYDFNQGNDITVLIGTTFKSPYGALQIELTPSFSNQWIGQEITVHKYNVKSVGAIYSSRLSVGQSDEESSIIDLSLNDENPERAEDILRSLISVYNDNWMKDKNRMAESTNEFINERLSNLTKELGNVDSDIASIRSRNLTPDVQASATMYMSQSDDNYKHTLELQNQLSMTQFLEQSLRNNSSKQQLLPLNTVGNANIESQIEAYNTLLLTRNDIAANSNEQNPEVKKSDVKLMQLKTAILRSVQNTIAQIKSQIANYQRSEAETNNKIALNPKLEKDLQSVKRQQDVKQSLYIYLLQKREENELSKTYTAWNTRIIQPPFGSNAPTSPQRSRILLIALFIGLVVPGFLLWLREYLNQTVRGRKDIDFLNIPFIGEIPNLDIRNHWWQKTQHKQREIVIEQGNRNMVNESFRIVRTKLHYFLGAITNKTDGTISKKPQVIMVTSFNQGSGKTFITANLAKTISLNHHRVLVVDMDIRRCSLSQMLPQRTKSGVSAYLSGITDNIDDLIIKDAFGKNVDVLPSGIVPPNPTELLQSSRLTALMKEMREIYDYIYLDCPPIEIVADTSIIKPHCDATLFVVRVGVMDRRLIPEIEKLYKENSYNNMAIILNGSNYISGKYGSYRYGNSYGYGGYGYGSYGHYGQTSDE